MEEQKLAIVSAAEQDILILQEIKVAATATDTAAADADN